MTHPSADASLPTSLLDDSALPDDPAGLRAEIVEVDARIAACEKEIRSLMQREDPAAGCFLAAEIHEQKQLRMMLRYQRDLRTARLNRCGFAEN